MKAEETAMEREIRERIGRTERAMREAARGIDRVVRTGIDAKSLTGVVAPIFSVVLRHLYLWWLGRRRSNLSRRLYEARRRAAQDRLEARVRGHEAEQEQRRRIWEAAAEISNRHDGRPAMICGREPESWEEVRLVEDFIAGAEERHDVVSSVWWADGSEAARRVREDLERDLPLRRYERRRRGVGGEEEW